MMVFLVLLIATAGAQSPPPPNPAEPAAEPTAEPAAAAQQPDEASFPLQVTCFDPVQLPCVDCGKFPAPAGSFCDGEERPGADGQWRGRPCLAVQQNG